MVQLYTSRHLTFSGDILRAFSGILALFGRLGKSDFVNGLPLKMLAPALLWSPHYTASQCHLKRRRSSPGELKYPSWSWAGWEGPVTYATVFRSRYGQGPRFDPRTDTRTQVLMKQYKSISANQGPISVLSFKATLFDFRPTSV